MKVQTTLDYKEVIPLKGVVTLPLSVQARWQAVVSLKVQ